MEEILRSLNKEVQLGEIEKVKQLIQAALDQGISAMAILEKGLRSAMEEVGRKFEELEIFLPEMMSAADAMKAGVEVLQPHLGSDAEEGRRGSILLGTVAIRVPGQKLEWNHHRMKVTNNHEANRLVNRPRRGPWQI